MRKVILLVFAAMLLVSSVAAAPDLQFNQIGDLIRVEITGMNVDYDNPCDIYVNGVLYSKEFPDIIFMVPIEGRPYLDIVVWGEDGNAFAAKAYSPRLYTFEAHMWGIVALIIVFLLLSLRFPIASIIAFVMSGFFVLQVIPVDVYPSHLKIFAGFLFALGISSLFMVINRDIV